MPDFILKHAIDFEALCSIIEGFKKAIEETGGKES